MTVRNIRPGEAQAFFRMQQLLDSETNFMLYEPGERTLDLERIDGFIHRAQIDDLLLVADDGGEIVGFISAQRGTANRLRHTAYIVVGIREAHRGQGIGSAFFRELDRWAVINAITRLELTVRCENAVAKHLYEKNGFAVEGIRKNALLVDGAYADEFYMAKLFQTQP